MKYIIIIIIAVLAVIVGAYIFQFKEYPISKDPTDWNIFASYLNSLMNPVLTFVNIIVLLGVGQAVRGINHIKREHLSRLEAYNAYSRDNEYKVVINPNAKAEDNLNELEKQITQIEGLFESFRKSDERCEADLYQLAKRAGLSEEATQLLRDVPYYENPFVDRMWAPHNLGVNNTMTYVYSSFLQLKINVYELLLKENSKDNQLRTKYLHAQKELEKYHKVSMTCD